MKEKLKQTTLEALGAVAPITVIVFLLSVFVAPMKITTLGVFLFGAIMLVVGMGLFTMGSEMALMPMGEGLGVQLTKIRKIVIVAVIALLMGTIVTIAEPDLAVLADLVASVDSFTLKLTIGIGVGVFLVLAILRILFRISLPLLIVVGYSAVFILSIFVPPGFLAVSFDSGGVTTGPITVPFILALGLGLSSVRGDKESKNDSFGLVALCSIGPILAMMVLGMLYQPDTSPDYPLPLIPGVDVIHETIPAKDFATNELLVLFGEDIPTYVAEVAESLWPIFAVLIIFQLLSRRFHKKQLLRIVIGLVYTYIGLVLFMTGVNVGFIPVGQSLGASISALPYNWLLIPIGMLVGYFIVAAEPAVIVLKKQIEEVSGGVISAKAVQTTLSISVSFSLGLAMLRVLYNVPLIFFLIPGYAIAIILSFFVPKIFTGIAFDSGGVVTGPMTSTFLLPFAIGACKPEFIMTDAFGLVAMVAMTPLIAIQVMGFVYKNKMKNLVEDVAERSDFTDDIITEFNNVDIADLADNIDIDVDNLDEIIDNSLEGVEDADDILEFDSDGTVIETDDDEEDNDYAGKGADLGQ
ncbi:membrane protein [Clostridia bacterium]|nr:membrane protein [Clostridia bacterium]GHV10898.1 membrane protein [Clostridia bacterium]